MVTLVNPARAVWDFLRGEDLKVHPPAPSVENGAIPPGTAQEKLYYYETPFIRYTWNMVDYNGPLVHGPGASAYYGGLSAAPVASNSAVFACMSVITKAHQEAPLRVYRRTEDGKEEWLRDHPFQDFADDPHEGLTHTEVSWWRLVAAAVHGNAYLRKVRAVAGNPLGVELLSPTRMAPYTSDADRQRGVFITSYRYEYEPGKYEDIPKAEVIHFRVGVDDNDHRVGLSPLQRVIREVCTDVEAMAFTEALLKNTGAAGLVVTQQNGSVPMTKEQAQELKERVDAAFAGSNRGKTAVLAGGADIKQMGLSPQAMNLRDMHRIPEERIAAVLGVHPMVAGLGAGLERSTFSNFEEARDALFEQTILPLYAAEVATWTKQVLRPDFDTDPDVFLKYDVSDVRALQEDQNDIYARLSVAVEKKWITRNEARSEVGFPPIEGWDEEDTQPAAEAAAALFDATSPPPPQLPSGDEEAEEDESAPARRSRLPVQRKARGAVEAIPGMLDALHELARPALERDLETYFAAQRRRVLSRARQQAGSGRGGGAEMPGRIRGITDSREHVYERLKKKGMPKRKAARIANAGKTKAGRSRMAKKAARTRKGRRGR